MAKTKIHYPQWNAQGGSVDRERGGSGTLADAIALTAEACGHALSASAVEMLAQDLSHFDDATILAALARCRWELEGPLRIPEILVRIEDGRPDADEAWSMMPADEQDSVVWSEEMTRAWAVAHPLLEARNVEAARHAFMAAYDKAVLEARAQREPPHWTPSLGLDPTGRELALREAVIKGRTTAAQAELLLGYSLAVPEEESKAAQETARHLH